MSDNLKDLVKAYKNALAELERAISNYKEDDIEVVRRCDENLSNIVEAIVDFEPVLEQRLTRIIFISELILMSFVNEDCEGSKLISIIRGDARVLHKAALRSQKTSDK
ncbi:MAG: hypothetical protein AAF478_02645 [Pseudomonadota bacterium]